MQPKVINFKPMNINLVVIKTSNPDELAKQYEMLGIRFEYHHHAAGPYHYAASVGELTFEIYPLPRTKTESDNTTRLGFNVTGLDHLIQKIMPSNWKIIAPPATSEFGYTAILEDLDGRKIELKEN